MPTKKYSGSKTNNKKSGSKKNKEIWKPLPIKTLSEKYQVSNLGNIRNVTTKNVLKPSIRSKYKSVFCSINNTRYSPKIHRMVALAFIPNPAKKRVVNHINGDRMDNRAVNLEWCTDSRNNKHAIETGLNPKSEWEKEVMCYDPKSEIYEIYESVLEASKKTGVSEGAICGACDVNNKKGYSKGYYWCYVHEYPNNVSNVDLSKYKQIIDFPNYVINTKGKIYSLSYKRFMKFQNHSGDAGKMVQLTNNDKKKEFLIHRLVAQYFLKKKKSKYNSVHHIDEDKSNNYIDNLEWCCVHGCPPLESKYKTSYYDPKTCIKPTKRKSVKSGPKDLLTANRRNLSKKQRIEQDKLKTKLNAKNNKKKTIEV